DVAHRRPLRAPAVAGAAHPAQHGPDRIRIRGQQSGVGIGVPAGHRLEILHKLVGVGHADAGRLNAVVAERPAEGCHARAGARANVDVLIVDFDLPIASGHHLHGDYADAGGLERVERGVEVRRVHVEGVAARADGEVVGNLDDVDLLPDQQVGDGGGAVGADAAEANLAGLAGRALRLEHVVRYLVRAVLLAEIPDVDVVRAERFQAGVQIE